MGKQAAPDLGRKSSLRMISAWKTDAASKHAVFECLEQLPPYVQGMQQGFAVLSEAEGAVGRMLRWACWVCAFVSNTLALRTMVLQPFPERDEASGVNQESGRWESGGCRSFFGGWCVFNFQRQTHTAGF